MKCGTCGKMNCYEHGGHVDDGLSPDEKREARSARHPVSLSGGPGRAESRHGMPHRNQQGTSEAWSKGKSLGHHLDDVRGGTRNRREEAKENLGSLKSLPKPKLKGLAHGGKVGDPMKMYAMSPDVPAMRPKNYASGGDVDADNHRYERLDPDKAAAAQRGAQQSESLSQGWENIKNEVGGMFGGSKAEASTVHKANGGEIDAGGDHDGGMDVDSELMEMCADELLSAIESKDKKQILEAIKAIVMNCKE